MSLCFHLWSMFATTVVVGDTRSVCAPQADFAHVAKWVIRTGEG